MDIKTNNQWRAVLQGYELPESARAEFDYMEPEELDCASFVQFKGQYFDLNDFMRVEQGGELHKLGWHGVNGTGFFHAYIIKLSDCGESAIVGQLFS